MRANKPKFLAPFLLIASLAVALGALFAPGVSSAGGTPPSRSQAAGRPPGSSPGRPLGRQKTCGKRSRTMAAVVAGGADQMAWLKISTSMSPA
jgi:hypothetical protein